MSNPMNFASAVTGLPMGGKKKVHVRGRKPSGKPGASHLGALQKAHAAGDMKAARMHALNYAKASMANQEPDMDQMGGPSDMDTDNGVMAMPAKTAPAPVMPKMAAPNGRASIAKALMMRAKK